MKTTLTILLATLALSSASTFLTTALEGGLNLAREFDVNVTHVENDLRKYAEAISDEDVRAFANKVLKAHGKLAETNNDAPSACPGTFQWWSNWEGKERKSEATVYSAACKSVDWAYCKGSGEYHYPWKNYEGNTGTSFNPSKRGAPLWARRRWSKLGCNSNPTGSGSASASSGNTIIYDNTPKFYHKCAYIYESGGEFKVGSNHSWYCNHRAAQDCNGKKFVYYSYSKQPAAGGYYWTYETQGDAYNDFVCKHRKSAGCPCKMDFYAPLPKWEKLSEEKGPELAIPERCYWLYEWGGVYRPYWSMSYCNWSSAPKFYCNGYQFISYGYNDSGRRGYWKYNDLPSRAHSVLSTQFGCGASDIVTTCCSKERPEDQPEYWYHDGTDTPWEPAEYAPAPADSLTDDFSWTKWRSNRGTYVSWNANGPDGSTVHLTTDGEGRIPNDTDTEIQNKNDTAEQYGNTYEHTTEGCIGKTENPLIEVATGIFKPLLNVVVGGAQLCHACKCKKCDDDEADKALKYNIFGCLSAVIQDAASWAQENLKGWFSTWIDVFTGFAHYTYKFWKVLRDHCRYKTGKKWEEYKERRDADLNLGDTIDDVTSKARDKKWDWAFDIVGSTRDNVVSGIKDFIVSIIVDVAISAATAGAGAVVNGFKWGGKLLIYLYYCGGAVKKAIEAIIQLVQEWLCTGCKKKSGLTLATETQAPRCTLFFNLASATIDLALCAAIDWHKWARKCGCSRGRANRLVSSTFGMSVWTAMGW